MWRPSQTASSSSTVASPRYVFMAHSAASPLCPCILMFMPCSDQSLETAQQSLHNAL